LFFFHNLETKKTEPIHQPCSACHVMHLSTKTKGAKKNIGYAIHMKYKSKPFLFSYIYLVSEANQCDMWHVIFDGWQGLTSYCNVLYITIAYVTLLHCIQYHAIVSVLEWYLSNDKWPPNGKLPFLYNSFQKRQWHMTVHDFCTWL